MSYQVFTFLGDRMQMRITPNLLVEELENISSSVAESLIPYPHHEGANYLGNMDHLTYNAINTVVSAKISERKHGFLYETWRSHSKLVTAYQS